MGSSSPPAAAGPVLTLQLDRPMETFCVTTSPAGAHPRHIGAAGPPLAMRLRRGRPRGSRPTRRRSSPPSRAWCQPRDLRPPHILARLRPARSWLRHRLVQMGICLRLGAAGAAERRRGEGAALEVDAFRCGGCRDAAGDLRCVVALLPSALAAHFLVATTELHLVVHEFELSKDGAARWRPRHVYYQWRPSRLSTKRWCPEVCHVSSPFSYELCIALDHGDYNFTHLLSV